MIRPADTMSRSDVNKSADVLPDVKNLKTYLFTDERTDKSVDSVTFHVQRGETLEVVGESGSGRTVEGEILFGIL